MKVSIFCPSPLSGDSAVNDIIATYAKRMDYPVDIRTPKVKTGASDPAELVKKKQGEALCAELEKYHSCKIIALDEHGKNMTSRDFATMMENAPMEGYNHVCFIIGGAYGLSSDILAKAHQKISFGAMTWPHRLVSAMLFEQLYRSQQIIKGHPYHKD